VRFLGSQKWGEGVTKPHPLRTTRGPNLQKRGKNLKLKIVLEKGMDGYIVAYCPALKGCVTQGRTEEEAIENIKEAIELYLEAEPQDLKRPAGQYKVCEVAL